MRFQIQRYSGRALTVLETNLDFLMPKFLFLLFIFFSLGPVVVGLGFDPGWAGCAVG
jgi:hypothetical protein